MRGISFTDVTVEREAIDAMSAANERLEQRLLERRLAMKDALEVTERANPPLARFVAAVSHNLLQPLSAAKFFVSLLANMDLKAEARLVTQRAEPALRAGSHAYGRR